MIPTTSLILHNISKRLSRPRIIFDRYGKAPYLSRWYLVNPPTRASGGEPFDVFGNPYNDVVWGENFGVYLHRFHKSDDDVQLHNHPWSWAVAIVLAGGYSEEHRVNDVVMRRDVRPGSVNVIRDSDFHRVDLYSVDSWSLFIAGPKVASWGFWDRVTKRFLPWRDHIRAVRLAAGVAWDVEDGK